MIISPAKRTESIREYYFSLKLKEIAKMNESLERQGLEKIINLGIGAPDGMPPQPAIDKLCSSANNTGNQAYQPYIGLPELRQEFANWYQKYYNVRLNPSNQIQPLFGSKEGILLISLAFINKGDKVLIPDPGYPTYVSASKMVEAEVIPYDLKEENSWFPDFDALEKTDLEGVKIMWTNYPNMPTGASASRELYQRLVDFGRKHKILIVNDNPYSFILNDKPLSILEAEGAFECCIELNSLSKAHNMSGWRIGMAAGDSDLISEVLKVKSQMDSGMYKPMQLAAIEALKQDKEWFDRLNEEYRRRRELAGKIFDLTGAKYDKNSAGLFLWGRIEKDNKLLEGSQEEKTLGEMISDKILYESNVFITPGFIFGKNGNDYIRISLCARPEILEKAYVKIKNIMK